MYERLDQALAWADAHDRKGTDLFVGVNARSGQGKTKASVPAVTCCFADLDLAGQGIEDALAALTDGPTPPPSFIVQSGYGVHAIWLLREPSRDKARWRAIQQVIVRSFADYGADPVCAPNEACILRLVPYPNRKLSPEGVPTALVMESGTQYDLAALLDAPRYLPTGYPRNGSARFDRPRVVVLPFAQRSRRPIAPARSSCTALNRTV